MTIEESVKKDGEIVRSDGRKGYTRVRVEPSMRIHPGLFMETNDHFETKDSISTVGCDEIINILRESWEASYRRSEEIMYSLLERLVK